MEGAGAGVDGGSLAYVMWTECVSGQPRQPRCPPSTQAVQLPTAAAPSGCTQLPPPPMAVQLLPPTTSAAAEARRPEAVGSVASAAAVAGSERVGVER